MLGEEHRVVIEVAGNVAAMRLDEAGKFGAFVGGDPAAD